MVEITPMLLRPAEAAKLLSLGESTVYRMAANGELPAVRIGRTVRFRRADLVELIDKLKPATPVELEAVTDDSTP